MAFDGRHKYLPFLKGKYEVSPGLKPLGTDFGRGEADQQLFQIGDDVQSFLKNKQACREENIKKYYCTHRENIQTIQSVNAFIIETLARDYPTFFQIQKAESFSTLHCGLTKEKISFSKDYTLKDGQNYLSLFDALCAQVPEDMAVWQVKENTDWLATLHVCSPNYWSPREKVGKNFSDFHAPVPGLEGLRQRYFPMLQSIVEKGSFVRFSWGLTTDCRLNHHPEPPNGINEDTWQGRKFATQSPKLYVRTERQTLTGLQEDNAVLFTIRTYFTDVASLNVSELQALESAVLSMSAASLVYKGLDKSRSEVLAWLRNLCEEL